MKYIMVFFLAIGFATSMTAQDDAISRFFSNYMEDDDFTSVYISPKMFQMISKLDLDNIDDPDAQATIDMIKDIKGLRILTSQKNPMDLYKEAMQKFRTSEYETLMSVKDGGENVRFWIKETDNYISELLLLVGGKDEFVLLSFVGKIDLNKISKLANSIDVKGAEYLDKVKAKE